MTNGGGDNLLIFLQKQPMSCEFAGLLKTRSWFDFFFESCGENRFVPKANAVFSIRSFGIDETIHLLRRRQLLNGLTFPDGVRAAADKLLYAQRQTASDHRVVPLLRCVRWTAASVSSWTSPALPASSTMLF